MVLEGVHALDEVDRTLGLFLTMRKYSQWSRYTPEIIEIEVYGIRQAKVSRCMVHL